MESIADIVLASALVITWNGFLVFKMRSEKKKCRED